MLLERMSSGKKIVNMIVQLKRFARKFRIDFQEETNTQKITDYYEAENHIIHTIHNEMFHSKIQSIRKKTPLDTLEQSDS